MTDELLRALGKDNRMFIATKMAIRGLQEIVEMDEGQEREKKTAHLLARLIELEAM